MNIHVVWTQGWDLAPPRALHNALEWEKVGTVHRWCEKTAAACLGISPVLLAQAQFPAMKADVILAAAMLTMGGMAVGADMLPLMPEEIKKALRESEKLNHALVVYQSHRDEPYSGASYFPKGHPWIKLVHEKQKNNVPLHGDSTKVSLITGPAMWRGLMRRNYGLWLSTVRTVPAWIAFSQEPKTRGTFRAAWIDPGLTGDWLGNRLSCWQSPATSQTPHTS